MHAAAVVLGCATAWTSNTVADSRREVNEIQRRLNEHCVKIDGSLSAHGWLTSIMRSIVGSTLGDIPATSPVSAGFHLTSFGLYSESRYRPRGSKLYRRAPSVR
jgi:hypothetical protein